jgi:hypothetical protein
MSAERTCDRGLEPTAGRPWAVDRRLHSNLTAQLNSSDWGLLRTVETTWPGPIRATAGIGPKSCAATEVAVNCSAPRQKLASVRRMSRPVPGTPPPLELPSGCCEASSRSGRPWGHQRRRCLSLATTGCSRMPAVKGSHVAERPRWSAHGLNTYSRSRPRAITAAFPSCLSLKP